MQDRDLFGHNRSDRRRVHLGKVGAGLSGSLGQQLFQHADGLHRASLSGGDVAGALRLRDSGRETHQPLVAPGYRWVKRLDDSIVQTIQTLRFVQDSNPKFFPNRRRSRNEPDTSLTAGKKNRLLNRLQWCGRLLINCAPQLQLIALMTGW